MEIIDRSLAMGHRITSVLSALNIARSTYYHKKPTTTTDTLQKPNLMKNLDDLSGVLTTDITYIQLMNRN